MSPKRINRVVLPLTICAVAAFASTLMGVLGLPTPWALGMLFAALLMAVLVSVWLMVNRSNEESQ